MSGCLLRIFVYFFIGILTSTQMGHKIHAQVHIFKFAIKNQITNPADLTEFNEQGYFFDSTNSDLHAPVFLREDQS